MDGETLLVEADAPIVGQELRLHADELAAAFRGGTGRRRRASAARHGSPKVGVTSGLT